MSATIGILNQWAEGGLSFAWPMLWQSSLLIGVLFALDYLLRRRVRAAVVYALWLSVLVKLLLPPSLALPSGIGYWLRPAVQPTAVDKGPAIVVTFGADHVLGLSGQSLPIPPSGLRAELSPAAWGLVLSGCASLGLLAWMLVQWTRVARETQRAEPGPGWLNELIEEARCCTGVRVCVGVRVIERAVSPAVCGMFHPIILLPRILVEQLTRAQMRSILLHEVIHVRRRDVSMNCAQTMLQVIYWWHPFLWLANARIRRAREEAVDDAVMHQLRHDADAYAPTLLQVAKLVLHRRLTTLGLVGVFESQGSLRRRIERLIDFHAPRTAGLTFASGLCILAFGALALPMGQAPAKERGEGASPAIGSLVAIPTTNAPIIPVSNPADTGIVSGDPSSEESKSQKAKNADLVQEARALFEMGKLKSARKILKEVLEQDPHYQAARYYLDIVNEAELKNAIKNRDVAFQETAEPRPPLIQTNGSRMALLTKLRAIRMGSVQFDNLTLDTVIRFLNDQTRKLDPAQEGIKFTINPGSGNGDSGPAGSEPGDISAVRIKILPALSDVRVADVLDAIVKVADRPIQYSIEEHSVVFTWKARGPLYTRLIKINPNAFKEALKSALGDSPPKPGGERELARQYFETLGLDLNPPKVVFYNEPEGTLLVHATLSDLDTIEAALPRLTTQPPQLNIKTRFFEVPEELAGSVWRLLTATNQYVDKASGLTAVLTSPQWSVFRQSLESSSEVKFLNEASVTTLNGRQFEVQEVDLKTITTNINPRALNPPGVSTRTEGGGGVYLEGQVQIGPIIDAIATAQVSSNLWQIQLNATASMTELSYYEPTNRFRVYVDGKRKSVPFAQPHFRTRKMSAGAVLYDGQALVIGTPMDESPHGTERLGNKGKRLLTVITPTIIDPSGNQMHPEGKLFSR